MVEGDAKVGVQKRIRRIAGQISGISRMVDEDRYCVDVLQQITAVRAALSKVAGILLESHFQTCVKDAFHSEDPVELDKKIAELVLVFDKSCKG